MDNNQHHQNSKQSGMYPNNITLHNNYVDLGEQDQPTNQDAGTRSHKENTSLIGETAA